MGTRGALNDIPPYVLPGSIAVFETLIQDWPVLSQSLLTTLETTLEGFGGGRRRGIALALLFNQSKWLEYSLFPYAVILQVTPVIAIRAAAFDLSAAANRGHRLRLDRRVLSVLSNTTLGLNSVGPQPGRPVQALRRVAAADAGLSQAAFRVALHPRRIAYCRAGCR